MDRNNIRRERANRVPLGERDILTVKGIKDTNDFVYRWVNDRDDRLQKLWDAGYEFVDAEGKIVGDNVDSGRKAASVMVKDVGQGVKAYLMKQPRDIWLADRKKRVDEPTDATEETILNEAETKGLTGKVEITRGRR